MSEEDPLTLQRQRNDLAALTARVEALEQTRGGGQGGEGAVERQESRPRTGESRLPSALAAASACLCAVALAGAVGSAYCTYRAPNRVAVAVYVWPASHRGGQLPSDGGSLWLEDILLVVTSLFAGAGGTTAAVALFRQPAGRLALLSLAANVGLLGYVLVPGR